MTGSPNLNHKVLIFLVFSVHIKCSNFILFVKIPMY